MPGTAIGNVTGTGSEYFSSSTSGFMVSYRVADLHGLIAVLREEGCNVLDKVEESELGRFGWVLDPEGSQVDLWEPPAGQ